MKTETIVALDGMNRAQALAMAEQLSGSVWGFKVNDLLVDCGVEIISTLKKFGKVFADPKLYDIPNTVGNSVKKIADAGADLITIHASGGEEMIAKAVENSGKATVLTVTVLTSFSEEGVSKVYGADSSDTVIKLAKLAAGAGASGIVCSAKELELIKGDDALSSLTTVVPGIRPRWYGKADDQKRVMTPADAAAAGANYLVIGRPITSHNNPIEAVKLITEELAA